MQELINKYFKQLCTGKFFKNDDETIIGKVKDVIEDLEQQSLYVNNHKNNFDEETIEFITEETKELIHEIKNKYSNENDVIEISVHPMAGFYVLIEQQDLLDELQAYIDDEEAK